MARLQRQTRFTDYNNHDYDPSDLDDYAYLDEQDDYEAGRRDEYYDARSEDRQCYPQDYDRDE